MVGAQPEDSPRGAEVLYWASGVLPGECPQTWTGSQQGGERVMAVTTKGVFCN